MSQRCANYVALLSVGLKNRVVKNEIQLKLPILETRLYSLTQAEFIDAKIVRPDRYRDLQSVITRQNKIIAQGAGLSYCLATASRGGLTINMRAFNRIVEFNSEENFIVVEAGMSIGELLMFLLPRGFWFSVIPGYPKISLGGCLAFNIHGKSQYHQGLFGDQVLGFTLLHPQKGEIEVAQGDELFDLSLGGMGLTGVVTKIKLKISKQNFKSILKKRIPISHIGHAQDLFEKSKGQCDQMYSWHNLNLKRKDFGRGYIYLETFARDEYRSKFQIGKLDSSHLLNAAIKVLGPMLCDFINPVYELLEKLRASQSKQDILNASFPLNHKEIYFKACGSRRFYEYQCIVPFDYWYIFIEKFSDLKSKWDVECSLGSLKLFKGEQKLLHFTMSGICFTVDILASAQALKFLQECDELLLNCKALPNISKDSRLSAEVVQKAYLGYSEFKSKLNNFDEQKMMSSSLRERLDV